jgi:hypothetical protein
MCFHYFRAPQVLRPPESPLPAPSENSRWYGEFWLKYPLGTTLYPSNSGNVFKARAEFAVIMNDAAQRLFGESSQSSGLSTVQVSEFYPRLKSWYHGLPEALSPRRAVLPSHLKLQ